MADISATCPHHFRVISANFWRKIKVDSVLEACPSSVVVNQRRLIYWVSAGPKLKPQSPRLIFVSASLVQKSASFLNQDQKFCTNSCIDSGGKQEVKVHNQTHRTTLSPFLLIGAQWC